MARSVLALHSLGASERRRAEPTRDFPSPTATGLSGASRPSSPRLPSTERPPRGRRRPLPQRAPPSPARPSHRRADVRVAHRGPGLGEAGCREIACACVPRLVSSAPVRRRACRSTTSEDHRDAGRHGQDEARSEGSLFEGHWCPFMTTLVPAQGSPPVPLRGPTRAVAGGQSHRAPDGEKAVIAGVHGPALIRCHGAIFHPTRAGAKRREELEEGAGEDERRREREDRGAQPVHDEVDSTAGRC